MTPDYEIGPGDELLIRAWGQVNIDYRAVVDRYAGGPVDKEALIEGATVRTHMQAVSRFIRRTGTEPPAGLSMERLDGLADAAERHVLTRLGGRGLHDLTQGLGLVEVPRLREQRHR